jgi:hypothetical protein
MKIMTDTSNFKPIPFEIQSTLMVKISNIAIGIANIEEIIIVYKDCLLEWLDEISDNEEDNEEGGKRSRWADARHRDIGMLHMLEQKMQNTLPALDILIDYAYSYEGKLHELNNFLEAIPTQTDKNDQDGRETEGQTQQS